VERELPSLLNLFSLHWLIDKKSKSAKIGQNWQLSWINFRYSSAMVSLWQSGLVDNHQYAYRPTTVTPSLDLSRGVTHSRTC